MQKYDWVKLGFTEGITSEKELESLIKNYDLGAKYLLGEGSSSYQNVEGVLLLVIRKLVVKHKIFKIDIPDLVEKLSGEYEKFCDISHSLYDETEFLCAFCEKYVKDMNNKPLIIGHMENSLIKNIISQVQHNYDAGKDEAVTIREINDMVNKSQLLSRKTDGKYLPTKWFKTEQITTHIGGEEGGMGLLVVNHQCGDNTEELIRQLKTLISGLENGFDVFSS
jgi:hypothetical protein